LIGHDLSIFRLKGVEPTFSVIQRLKSNNLTIWQKKFQAALAFDLGAELNSLFNWQSKQTQQQLLAPVKLSADSLFAFMIQAGDSHGYRYSRYITEHRPKELEKKKYPGFIHRKSKDEYITQGDTDLTANQFKFHWIFGVEQ